MPREGLIWRVFPTQWLSTWSDSSLTTTPCSDSRSMTTVSFLNALISSLGQAKVSKKGNDSRKRKPKPEVQGRSKTLTKSWRERMWVGKMTSIWWRERNQSSLKMQKKLSMRMEVLLKRSLIHIRRNHLKGRINRRKQHPLMKTLTPMPQMNQWW